MADQDPRKPLLAGIIGYPVGHSVSPVLQQAAFDHEGLNVRYERWETPPDHLAPRLLNVRRPGVLGANVTVPHKENALRLVDDVDDFARRIGAVNTIVNREGRLTGYNTDAPGFIRALRQDGGIDPKGLRVWVLGAGGAARAVVFGLLREGVSSVVISNRTHARGQALADAAKEDQPGCSVLALPFGQEPGTMDLIVSTTTVGMRHGPAEGESLLEPGNIPAGALVCDIVYNPAETPLLIAARTAGARTLGGLPMLIYQGAIAFELWTGRPAPIGMMTEAARGAL